MVSLTNLRDRVILVSTHKIQGCGAFRTASEPRTFRLSWVFSARHLWPDPFSTAKVTSRVNRYLSKEAGDPDCWRAPEAPKEFVSVGIWPLCLALAAGAKPDRIDELLLGIVPIQGSIAALFELTKESVSIPPLGTGEKGDWGKASAYFPDRRPLIDAMFAARLFSLGFAGA